MKKREAFTLIELIAVLVILAILALIVTPLVLNIIKKARTSADKRSIDAYGRSIELAIADYLLDKGEFPTSIDQLTIEYNGYEVVCSTTQLNNDSSVYLAECTVGGRIVDYTYGKDNTPTYEAYSVGDRVNYNNVDYYVIKNSGVKNASVTLLKNTPLTVDEVNAYGGVGTSNNHVNMYVTNDAESEYYQTAYNQNGYGGMAYYSSTTCNGYGDTSECKSDYESSEIKFVVDAWAQASTDSNDLIKDSTGYSVRLLTKDEFLENCEEEEYQSTPSDMSVRYIAEYPWLKDQVYYSYWGMDSFEDSKYCNVSIDSTGYIGFSCIHNGGFTGTVRPVIIIKKSALD